MLSDLRIFCYVGTLSFRPTLNTILVNPKNVEIWEHGCSGLPSLNPFLVSRANFHQFGRVVYNCRSFLFLYIILIHFLQIFLHSYHNNLIKHIWILFHVYACIYCVDLFVYFAIVDRANVIHVRLIYFPFKCVNDFSIPAYG